MKTYEERIVALEGHMLRSHKLAMYDFDRRKVKWPLVMRRYAAGMRRGEEKVKAARAARAA